MKLKKKQKVDLAIMAITLRDGMETITTAIVMEVATIIILQEEILNHLLSVMHVENQDTSVELVHKEIIIIEVIFKLVGASPDGKDVKPNGNPSSAMHVNFEKNKNRDDNKIRGNEAYPAEQLNRVLRSTQKMTEPYDTQKEDKNDNIPLSPPTQIAVHNVQNNSGPVMIENKQQLQQPMEDINKTKTKAPKKKVLKKKVKANLHSPISSHVQPYSMVEDIKHQQAWITFGQLIEIAPKCKTELAREIRKPTTRKIHFSDMELKENQKSTAMYCDATVREVKVPPIIDSRAAESIVAHHFLLKLGVNIDQPSTASIVNVNGKRKILIGEVLNFPITVQGNEVPINMVITEAETYSVIVGNDWLRKVKANIDYKTSTIIIN
ncbi:unnamed protein product [Rhizophagus irregularis]|nr:unnamed protein product [Rhizophagus irregularis]CAB5374278.1 unnamed protein product [Rhizophagus irregularis]